MVGAVICFASTGGAPATAAQSQSGFTTWQRVRLAFGNKPFVSLLCAKMANLTAVGWYFAVLPFLFTTVTRAGYAKLGLYFFAQGLATLFSQPFWVWTSRRIGKKRAFYITATCYGLGVATWFLAQPGDPVSYSLARGIVLGFLGGGSLLTASSMLPDAIEHDFNRTGLRREGIFAGVYTTVEKASAALSSSLIGVCLSIGGYVQGAHGAAVQPPSAILAIRLSTFAPLIFGVAGALILTTYRLPDKRVRDPS
jgi:GPH family glycoside/pentoside/hexuronide:cation symporter